ncbi:MAG TPA: ATP-binding protein [Candidatus Angelobacter sp.]|nr:ATP-binding protein [Candidatus Angelobacter sp.]
MGSTGIRKSFLACALAEKACRDGFTALYTRAAQLFSELALARADGSLGNKLARRARIDVLIVDDGVPAPLGESERREFLEICETVI